METTADADSMGRTSIQVTEELADELHERKQRGDSYEDVIWRLMGEEQPDEAAAEQQAAEPTEAPRDAPAPTDDPDKDVDEDVLLPEEIDADVWAVVDEAAEGWDDDGRIEHRRQAAAHVLQYAVENDEAVGRSHPVVAEAREAFPVEGQNEETYWRNNLRDKVLKKAGNHSKQKQGYVVEELGDVEGTDPYDPTEEFQ